MDKPPVNRIVPLTRIRRYNMETFERDFQRRMIGAAALTGLFVIVVVVAVRCI